MESRTPERSGRYSQISQTSTKQRHRGRRKSKKLTQTGPNIHHPTILPCGKGRTAVTRDTETYEQQMQNMLGDRDTYDILQKNPTEEKERTLKTLLKPLLESKIITKEAYDHLIPTANVTPQICGTPKIHKEDAPLRPIVDCIRPLTSDGDAQTPHWYNRTPLQELKRTGTRTQ